MVQQVKSNWQSWALGLFVSLAGIFGSYAWSTVSDAAEQVGAAKERIAIVETRQSAAEQQRAAEVEDLRRRLTRIEAKLDDLMLRKNER